MRAYLDHAATSRIRPVAAEVYARELTRTGNPSSLHTAGRAVRARLEEARERIAELLGARTSEVVFTSGGSEADAIAISGIPEALIERGECADIVISAIEHDAIRLSARRAAKLHGYRLYEIGTDVAGRLDLAELDEALTGGVGLVSVMWANNETGVIQPLSEVVERAHVAGALVHSDAVQAVGRVPVSFRDSGLAALSLTGEGSEQLPGFTHLIVMDAHPEALLLLADMVGIATASSSACHAGVQSLSHVVRALGYRDEDRIAPLRLSLGWDTTEDEVAHAAATLPGVIAQAQAAGGAR